MEDTDPELLWPLLLVQIVYDQLVSKDKQVDFNTVASTYMNHPLLPQKAPVLHNGRQAQQMYRELLKEKQIDSNLDPTAQAALLAEPLYEAFHLNLIEKMKDDVVNFEKAYREFEVEHDIPKDERLAEES